MVRLEDLDKLEQQFKSGVLSEVEYIEAIKTLMTPTLTERFCSALFCLFFWRTSGFLGFPALIVLLFVTGYQVTPGREWVKLDWPAETYYVVAGVAGALVGLLGGQRRVAALGCGAVAAIASLWLSDLTCEHQPRFLPNLVWGVVRLVVVVVGLSPGVLLYAVCDSLLPPVKAVGRCPNPACRSRRGWDGSDCRYCGTRAEPPPLS